MAKEAWWRCELRREDGGGTDWRCCDRGMTEHGAIEIQWQDEPREGELRRGHGVRDTSHRASEWFAYRLYLLLQPYSASPSSSNAIFQSLSLSWKHHKEQSRFLNLGIELEAFQFGGCLGFLWRRIRSTVPFLSLCVCM